MYLICTKRGNKTNPSPGKAKFEKYSEKILYMYEKCLDNNNHAKLDYENFKELYRQENLNMIDINNILYIKNFM